MYFNDQKQLNMLDTEALKPVITQLTKQKLYRVISISHGDQTGVIIINEDEEYFQLDEMEQITAKELKRDKGIKIEIVKHQKTNQNMVKTQSIKNSEITPNTNTANNNLKLTNMNTMTKNSVQTTFNMTQMKTTEELNEQIEITPKIPLVNSVLQVRAKNLNFTHIYCTQETNEQIIQKLGQTINLLFEHDLSFISVENLIQKAISAFTGTITEDYILLDVSYNNAVIPLLLPLLKIGICDNSGFAITPQCYQKYVFLNIFANKAVTMRGLTNKVKFGFNLRFDIQKICQNIKITVEGSVVYDQETLKHCNVKIEVKRNGVLISDKLVTEFKGEGLYNVKLSVEQEGEEEFSKFIR
ncbi:Hypothetical_protein [Hexamita inflata]|uniref:Hypothetical_protein n=1 Tax=Hexamita inflata TaxID=28002 RepID=A0AA86NLK9_9EUKA|nr:Hypothetical protein HINF_LOCUS8981 [Hexamita inflata]